MSADSRATIAHIRALDGLRGVAVLAVVVFHFAPDLAPGGFLGVDVFFVLSGFLITSLLVTEVEGTGTLRLGTFWSRRARRLFPALLLLLLAVGLYAYLYADPLEVRSIRDDGLAALFYVANWRFIASDQSYVEQFVGADPSPLRHTWSLAIEEQYYLLWPLVVMGLGVAWARIRGATSGRSLRGVVVVACVLIALGSSLLMAVIHQPGDDPSRVHYGTDTRAHLWLLGSALGALTAGALTVSSAIGRRALVVGGVVAAGVLVVLFGVVDASDTWLYEGGYAVFGLLVVAVIASAGQPGRHPVAWVLSTRPLVALGLISYGVYLWHWPITVWVDEASTGGLDGPALFALRSALTLAISIASYYLVEQPIRRGALRRLGPAVPWIATPLAVGTAIVVLLLPVWTTPEAPEVAGAAPSESSAETVEAYAEALGERDRAGFPPPPLRRIVLYGNSVADEVVEGLGESVARRGHQFMSRTALGAAMCDLSGVITRDLGDPTTRPNVALLYALPVQLTECSSVVPEDELVEEFLSQVERVVGGWIDDGVRVFLVPPVPAVEQTDESPVAASYRALAGRYAGAVSVLDAGTFLRDAEGAYQWRMPCLPGGEAGCEADGTVAVRMPLDGVHMCSDPNWRGGPCAPEAQAGQRRAAAAIARGLFAELRG